MLAPTLHLSHEEVMLKSWDRFEYFPQMPTMISSFYIQLDSSDLLPICHLMLHTLPRSLPSIPDSSDLLKSGLVLAQDLSCTAAAISAKRSALGQRTHLTLPRTVTRRRRSLRRAHSLLASNRSLSPLLWMAASRLIQKALSTDEIRSLTQCLVELRMKESRVEKLWDGVQDIPNMKRIVLNGSKQLIEIPDLSKALSLQELELMGCINLLSVHPSIFSLPKLVTVTLWNCRRLEKLPGWCEVKKEVLSEASASSTSSCSGSSHNSAPSFST
ncbi:hypothetical protein Ahy_A02g005305 isoform A [Arachis hypogaea]|uniref:Uncharacterized protein n=1 Tax=Arachis hypogaea TaxID=3818 RepID=A0A445E6A0_ARAHY|nr:hypothetical protein Ahy_A02g005305 isoform A [Arachis hypogaea]